MSTVKSAGEGLWVAARSGRGSLAHAIYVKDLDVFERRGYVVTRCYRAEANVLLSEGFDPEAEEHAGYKTCGACVRGVQKWERLMKVLKEYRRGEA